MTHIFISYSKKDTRGLALALADALNAQPGITAWVDRSLRAGQSWETQIQREIKRCDVMLVLYSPDINRHLEGEEESYVLTEIRYAKYTVRKPIIPVMAQPTDPPMSLTGVQYIDYTVPGLTLADLVNALAEELGFDQPPPPPKPSRQSSPELLPQPFAWIPIPAGHVTLVPDDTDKKESYLKATKTFDVPAFSIAKYPVTNAQFRLFWEAKGYEERRWWTEAGWQARLKGWTWKDGGYVETNQPWTAPLFWTDSQWNSDYQPAVGVSWYEAVAYCAWLSVMTGEPIMLPTEQRWQRAARGDDDRSYTWGSEWDAHRCNNNVDALGTGRTSSVKHYEGKGDSPFGVVDMAGNIWEWCVTAITTGSNSLDGTGSRLLLGGSWGDMDVIRFRCDYRLGVAPFNRGSIAGFRLARS